MHAREMESGAAVPAASVPVMFIDAVPELKRLARLASLPRLSVRPRVVLRLPHVSADQARVWEQRLETLRTDCGCAASAGAMGVFAIACVAWLLWSVAQSPLHVRPADYGIAGGVFVAGLILSALLGKLGGLWGRSLRYRRVCREIEGYMARRSQGDTV